MANAVDLDVPGRRVSALGEELSGRDATMAALRAEIAAQAARIAELERRLGPGNRT